MTFVRTKILDRDATIENYMWTAPDPMKGLLDTYLDPHGPSVSDPFPDMTVAREVISIIGGEIVDFDHPQYPVDGKERRKC
jgi:hypothetical protein